jgi:hypothetical protein
MIASLGLALAVAVAPQCAYVDRDIITGTDLLAADPAFAAIPPDRIVGRSPSPGRQRFFTVPELKAIAESSGLSLVPTQDVCFEWRTSVVSSEAAGAAMAEAYPEARIEVVEMSRYPAPSGSVVFPRASLQRVPAAVMLWRGYVVYGEERRRYLGSSQSLHSDESSCCDRAAAPGSLDRPRRCSSRSVQWTAAGARIRGLGGGGYRPRSALRHTRRVCNQNGES